MDTQFVNLQRKVNQYREVLDNTEAYREVWKESLCQQIMDQLNHIIGEVGLKAEVEIRAEMDNLEAVVLNLGTVRSGMSQRVNDHLQRFLAEI